MQDQISSDSKPQKGLSKVTMHFLTQKESGEPYLDRLEVYGYSSQQACEKGVPDHTFDSHKGTHWKDIWGKRTPALFGTLHTFVRAMRNGTARTSKSFKLCDSRELSFATTVKSAFNKGKQGAYDTWVREIIGIADNIPLIRFSFTFADKNRKTDRHYYMERLLGFQIVTTLNGENQVSDEQLQAIEAILARKIDEVASPTRSVQIGSGATQSTLPKVGGSEQRETHQVFYRKGDYDRALIAFAGRKPLFVVGSEGIGKSCLARELKRHWLQSCGKGRPVIWLDAALRQTTLAMIFSHLCDELSLPALRNKSLSVQAKELQSRLQQEPLLIVIENFERLENGYEAIEFLTQLEPPNKVIATGDEPPIGLDHDFSRIQLHLMNEEEMGLLFDSLADSCDLDATLRRERNQLIRIVGGHPGAMVKAVFALNDLFSFHDIAQPGFFDGIFEKTWDKLYPSHPDRCRVLLALACFPFGVTRATLASVTQLKPEQFQSALTSLRGLVEISSTSGKPRFSISSSLALVVRNRAQKDIPSLENSLKLRQVTHYVEFASQIGQCWDALEKMDPLDEIPEQQTIIEVIAFCEKNKMWTEMAEIAKGCRYHAYTRGHWSDPDSILKKWSFAAAKLGDLTQQFEAGTYLLNIQCKQQDPEAAESIIRLDRLKKKTGNLPESLVIRYLHAKALHFYSEGNLPKAETLWNEGIARNKKRGRKKDEHDQSAMVRWKGLCLLKQGRTNEARAAFEEHLRHAKKYSFARPALVARLNLEEVRFVEGDFKEVVSKLREMAQEIQDMHDQRLFADHRWLLGQSLFQRGEFSESKAALLDAADAYGRLGFLRRLKLANELLKQVADTGRSSQGAQ